MAFLIKPASTSSTAVWTAAGSNTSAFVGFSILPVQASVWAGTGSNTSAFVGAGGVSVTQTFGENTTDTFKTTTTTTTLSGANPATNYGGTTNDANLIQWTAGADSNGSWAYVIRYDLSSLPSDAVISNAVITFKTKNALANSATLEVYELLRTDWVLLQSTWTIWKTGSNWSTPGGRGAGTDVTGTPSTNTGAVATINVPASGPSGTSLVTTNLASYIQSKLNAGTKVINLIIHQQFQQSAFYVLYSHQIAAPDGSRPSLSITYTSANPPPSGGPGATGIFQAWTDGKFYDPLGNVFRGGFVNLFPGQNNAQIQNHIGSNCWGFKGIRLNAVVNNDANFTQQYSDASHDAVVDTFTALGIVVLCDWHAPLVGGFGTSAQSIAARNAYFTRVATKYKNNAYVWYDCFNEPGGLSDSQSDGAGSFRFTQSNLNSWVTLMRNTITTIRGTGATAPIICSSACLGQDVLLDSNWGQQFIGGTSGVANWSFLHATVWGTAPAAQVLSGNTNIGFSVHTYEDYSGTSVASPANSGRLTLFQAFADSMLSHGWPLMIGEYGAFNANAGAIQSARNLRDSMSGRYYLPCLWHGDANTVNSAVTGSVDFSTINNCSGAYNAPAATNLTEAGQIAWWLNKVNG